MSKNNSAVIVWFRQDLRLKDNPALRAAYKSDLPIIPLYILDDVNSGEWAMGAASRWWLHESLKDLNKSLDDKLCFAKGCAKEIFEELIKNLNISAVYWNRCYEPWRIKRDTQIKESLRAHDIEAKSFNGSLLFEPQTVLKEDGTPYKVFTPFYRKGCLGRAPEPRFPEKKPERPNLLSHEILSLDELELMPKIPWHSHMNEIWRPGEKGAKSCFNEFLEHGLKGYKEGRNFPSLKNVSRLSAYLHFGEISVNEVWHSTKSKMIADHLEADGDNFLSELGWREFSNSLLYHFPDLPRENLQKKFDHFSWREDEEALACWQQGKTGYPIVDAGMRELWQTGYMHGRVRMIVGSFLVKNLMLHWHHGENWFWDTLIDADLANNSASWQWIAGCGADAAPYFRVFNPVTQGKKFDSDGSYVRFYVPELSKLPDKYLHSPWEAPAQVLKEADVMLGTNYPEPIVDLKASRQRALDAFKDLSG